MLICLIEHLVLNFLQKDLCAHLEVLTVFILEACAGAIIAKVERG
jgi:hypothetical protein